MAARKRRAILTARRRYGIRLTVLRAAAAFVALVLGAVAPARGAIDASGKWSVRAQGTSGLSVTVACLADVAQSGTSFAVTGSCELVGGRRPRGDLRSGGRDLRCERALRVLLLDSHDRRDGRGRQHVLHGPLRLPRCVPGERDLRRQPLRQQPARCRRAVRRREHGRRRLLLLVLPLRGERRRVLRRRQPVHR